MMDHAKRVRVGLGLLVPGCLALPTLLGAVKELNLRQDWDWGRLAGGVLILLVLLGPFLVYYLGVRSLGYSIAFGMALVALFAYSVVRALTDSNSTAALNLLWIPIVGYPVAMVGVFMDRVGR